MRTFVFSNLRNVCVFLCALIYFANAWGQSDACEIRHVRVLETDDFHDVAKLNGVVFPPQKYSVLVLDQPTPGAGTVVLAPRGGLPGDPESLSLEISDPINITFDDRANRLFMFDDEFSELLVIYLHNRTLSSDAIKRFKTEAFGVVHASGIAVDPKTGTLFILDAVASKIVQVVPGKNRKSYEGSVALREGRVSQFFLPQDRGYLRGLGFNQADGGLYVFSSSTQELYKLTDGGELVSAGYFPGFNRIEPRAFGFARTLDQTDDPMKTHLYIVSGDGTSGQVGEWSVTPCIEDGAQ
jgi:hypothetical protein